MMKNNFESKDRVICVDAAGTRLEQGKEYILEDVYLTEVTVEGCPNHVLLKERFEHAPVKDKLEQVTEENKHGGDVPYESVYPHPSRRVTLTIECNLPECVNDGGVFGVTKCECCGCFSLYEIRKDILKRDEVKDEA
jgi:hypothetical protein